MVNQDYTYLAPVALIDCTRSVKYCHLTLQGEATQWSHLTFGTPRKFDRNTGPDERCAPRWHQHVFRGIQIQS